MYTASVRPKSGKVWVREIEGKKKKKSIEFYLWVGSNRSLKWWKISWRVWNVRQKETRNHSRKYSSEWYFSFVLYIAQKLAKLVASFSTQIIKGLSKSRVIKEGVVNAKYTDSNPLYVPPVVSTSGKCKKESKYQMNA